MIQQIIKFFTGKKDKIPPPDVRAIVKITDVAKENAVYDDENKIIEIIKYGKVQRIKYSEADVDSLREQGIPVEDEVYSEDYEFVNAETGGDIEYKR